LTELAYRSAVKKPNKTGLSSSASNPTPTIKQHVIYEQKSLPTLTKITPP